MKKVILGLIGAVFILLIAGVIALKVMFPAEKIKAMVIPEIEKVLGREVQVADAGINIFPTLGVSLQGLKIANTSDSSFTQAEMLELGEFRVDLAVMPLFAGQVNVQNILIDQLTVRIEANLAGTFNFADLKVLEKDSTIEEIKSTEPFVLPQLPIPLTLESFELRNMKVEFKDQKASRNITIGAINQKVSLSIDQNLEDIKTTGSLSIADISIQTKEIPFKLSDITVRSTHDLVVDLKKGNLTINKITGGLQKIEISLTGDVNNFLAEPTFNLQVNSDKIFFQDLLNEIPKSLSPEINKVKAQGYTLFSVLAKGSAEKPTVTGTLAVKQGRFQYADFPKALEALNLESDFSLEHFNLKNLSLELGKGNPVKVRALIQNFAAPLLDINIDTKIDLATLKELVELPKGTDFGGRILTDIKINGQVDPTNIENASKTVKVAGQVALQKIYAKTPQLKVPVNIDGNVDFSSQYLAPKVKVLLGESNIDFDGKLQDFLSFVIANEKAPTPSFDFTVKSKKLLIDKIIVVPEGPQKVEAEKPAGPPMVLLAAPLPLINITGDIAFNKVAYGAIDIQKLNTLLSLKNGLLDINTTASLFGGSLENKLQLNAANAPTVLLNIKTDVDRINSEKMLKAVTQELGNQKPIFAQIKKLDGSLNGNLSFNSEFTTQGITDLQVIEQLKGQFRASILKGVLKPGPVLKALGSSLSKYIEGFDAPIAFDNLVLKGRVDDQKLHIVEMDMKSSKLGQIIVDGTIGFDNSINLVVGDKLPASRSRLILEQQDKLVSATKGGAAKLTQGLGSAVSGAITSFAGSVIDNNKIPSDKDGRVTPEVNITGTLLDPSVSGFRFSSKGAVEGKKEDSPSVKQDLKNQFNAKKAELEAQAKARIAKEKAAALAKVNKAKADAMKKVNAKKAQIAKAKKEAEAKARAKAAKVKADAEKKAKDKLKSLF
ncbi:AsmA family protein [Fibrobacterales bacterium]|nr:AsmA family protein [Fibrobacterales bacterium]